MDYTRASFLSVVIALFFFFNKKPLLSLLAQILYGFYFKKVGWLMAALQI